MASRRVGLPTHAAAFAAAPAFWVWILLALLVGTITLPVTVFGLRQLANTTMAQFEGPAEVTDFLAYYTAAELLLSAPAELYDDAAQRRVERDLQAGRETFVPFVSPPFVPLLQASLALLPYGLAYLAWLCFGVGCVSLAAYLLAPRPWWAWLICAPLFLPLLLGLVMGQSSCVMLLGFCVFARWPVRHGTLGLLSWALKPNFLPVFAVALCAARAWRSIGTLGVAIVGVAGAALVAVGISAAVGFSRVAAVRWDVAVSRVDGYPEGVTLLTFAQDLLGQGPVASVAAVLGGIGVCGLVGKLWWAGLRSDPRRDLQLAALPVAAVLVAPHAGVYELTTWCATVWLLLRYVRHHPSAANLVLGLGLLIWCVGGGAVVAARSVLPGLMACVGLCVLGVITMLYRQHGSAPEASIRS